MNANDMRGLSESFKRSGAVDPHTAKEIHIRQCLENLKDSDALKALDELTATQKKVADNLRVSNDQKRDRKIRDLSEVILMEELANPKPVLQPKSFDGDSRRQMELLATKEATRRILSQDEQSLNVLREISISQQQRILDAAAARAAHKEFNENARSISIDFDSRGGRSR